jgi:hypothetical protein
MILIWGTVIVWVLVTAVAMREQDKQIKELERKHEVFLKHAEAAIEDRIAIKKELRAHAVLIADHDRRFSDMEQTY